MVRTTLAHVIVALGEASEQGHVYGKGDLSFAVPCSDLREIWNASSFSSVGAPAWL